jgi:hypothetical protein
MTGSLLSAGGAYENKKSLLTRELPPVVVMIMGRFAPTPAGVVHDSVNVARESVIGRPLSTARDSPVQSRPPMVMLQGSTPILSIPTTEKASPPSVDMPLYWRG